MKFDVDPIYIFYGFAIGSVVLVVEAVYILFFQTESYRNTVNRRLRLLRDEPNRETALVLLRRERGLTGDGLYLLPVAAFNRLVLQSGVTIGVWKILLIMAIGAVVASAAIFVVHHDVVVALGAGSALGLMLPLMALMFLRRRRKGAFGLQFPDAIDIIVRSIRAGHPVPIAITMVAREMPDPVGSEFGMLADELTYGSDLEGAMRNLLFRVGQEDLPLFVTAVAIQGSTGGNLAEILSNLSKVIRERFKMRRKIRSLSSEGRFSALALSAMPILLFVVVNTMSPGFYGAVWHVPMTQMVLGAAVGWMVIGNMVMFKMVNFKI